MLNYELPTKLRKQMAKSEPAVKAALCALANKNFSSSFRAEGICKVGGGIVVNGEDIYIAPTYIVNDNRPKATATAEEIATLNAIITVSNIIDERGIKHLKATFGECHLGDRLRDLTNSEYPPAVGFTSSLTTKLIRSLGI